MISGSWCFLPDSILNADDARQELAISLGAQDVLIVAPAGSGKTEVLARRATSLIQRKLVEPPRQLLALTFTNRAVENLRSRLVAAIGVGYKRYVTIENFHTFATRLLRAYGVAVNVTLGDWQLPDGRWSARTLQNIEPDWEERRRIESVLQAVKREAIDDATVAKRLANHGERAALEYEQRRVAEGQLDYDDLTRHAERILADPEIAERYQRRFPAVLLDEAQDLTPQQLRITTAVVGEHLTVAGDEAQAIFRFAGADHRYVFKMLHQRKPAVIELQRSYRSAPAVLQVVNRIGALTGASEVQCADPSRFPDEGIVATLFRENVHEEAQELLHRLSSQMLIEAHTSVGVVIRGGQRGSFLEAACTANGLSFQSWTRATHDPGVVALLRRNRHRATGSDDRDRLDDLERLCLVEAPDDDAYLLDSLRQAFDSLRDEIALTMPLDQALDECRSSGTREQPIGPGVHMLNGHKGKGQQFDWVIVLGAEADKMPSRLATTPEERAEELRVFGVMISRARYGLVLTAVEREQDRYGRWWPRDRSPWLRTIEPLVTQRW